jgi:Cu/Ag efflux protein CusF
MKQILALATVLATATLAPALASDKMDHGKMGHGAMEMKAQADEAEAKAVINSVDADGAKVNVTHEPVEALGWPKMTMDLPVTRRVDLSTVKTGEPVTIRIKQGRDKQFRIVEIKPAQ